MRPITIRDLDEMERDLAHGIQWGDDVKRLMGLARSLNFELSEARSKLHEQEMLINKAVRDLEAGAMEMRTARNEVLRADTEARRNDDAAQKFYRVMGLLKGTKMKHGLCKPRERRACTNCNAVEALDKMLAEYRGAPVLLK